VPSRASREEVAAQMNEDIRRLAHLIQLGVDGGQLAVGKPDSAARQIMSLVDALSVQSAIRGTSTTPTSGPWSPPSLNRSWGSASGPSPPAGRHTGSDRAPGIAAGEAGEPALARRW
jgi:hypothetical protein